MLSHEQAARVLRECIAPHAIGARTLVIEDRTGLLSPAIGDGMSLRVAGQTWFAIAVGPLLQVRRRLWEERPPRVAVLARAGESLAGLRDLTTDAPRVPVGGALLLRVLADVNLPDDSRLDPLVSTLLEHPARLRPLQGQPISRANLPRAVVSALLGEDLLDPPSDAVALARILRSEAPVPRAAHPLCREYAATLKPPYQRLVAGLLTFEHSRAAVARALLQAEISRRENQVPSDPLVRQFLEHTAVNDVTLLEAFAARLEESLLAEPAWGREFVRQLPAQHVTHPSPILPNALEADMRRQLDELIQGRRTALDDRLWRGHLFYDEYRPWIDAIHRLALLSQLQREIERLLADDVDLPRLIAVYVERVSAGDLAWLELDALAKQAIPLHDEIQHLRKAYQEARTALNRAFAERYARDYSRLFGSGTLPLVVHLLPQEIKPRLDAGEQVLVVIVDGLNYPLWQRFRDDLMVGGWRVEEDGYALALLPTITAVSRYAIFSGPVAQWVYPDLAEPDDEAPSEDEYKALQAALPGRTVAVFKKRDLKRAPQGVMAAIRGGEYDLVVVVINEVDEAIQSPAHAPFPLELKDYPLLSAVLNAARTARRAVFLVADHGFTPDGDRKWPVPAEATVAEARLLKIPSQMDGAADLPVVQCQDLVYDLGGPFLALYDFGGRFKHQPKVGYHSGIGLEEVVVPAAWLRVGPVTPQFDLRFVGVPAEVIEDDEVMVTLELRTPAGLGGEVHVEVWLPNQSLTFSAQPQPGLSFQQWQVSWRPTLPPREPVEAQAVYLRAVGYYEDREVAHAEVEVTVQPRRGKYESAAAALLPD